MSGPLAQEVEADVEIVWLDVVLALIIVAVLAAACHLTQGASKVVSISLLAGYLVFLVDFYGKDLVETVE